MTSFVAFLFRSARVSRRRRTADRKSPDNAPRVGDWETCGRGGRAGHETLPEPGIHWPLNTGACPAILPGDCPRAGWPARAAVPRQPRTRTTAASCRGAHSRSTPRATGDGREIPRPCSQEPRWPRRKAQDLGHHQEHHEPAERVDRSQPPGGGRVGNRRRGWRHRCRRIEIMAHQVAPREAGTRAITSGGHAKRLAARIGTGIITGHYSGLYFVLWPAGSGRRPLCDQEPMSLDRRSRQRGDDAEESLTLKVYVAENPVNVHDPHLSSDNPSHGASSSGRRTVRRGTIAEARLVRNWKRCVVAGSTHPGRMIRRPFRRG